MVTLGLAQRIPKSIRRSALKPDQKDLGDVRDNIKHGNGNEAAADFRIYSKTLGSDSSQIKKEPNGWELDSLLCPFISIKNAATATFPIGMARLKKKTVIQVKRRKLCSSPSSVMVVKWFPRPCRMDTMPNICVTTVNTCRQVRRYTHDNMGGNQPRTQAMRAQTNADVPNLFIRSRT